MLEQAGMSSQHGGEGLPFFATAGSAMTGFKANGHSTQTQSTGSDPCKATSGTAVSPCGN